MLRTHTCGQLNENNLEEKVTLVGWVSSRRDHGKIIFVDLRDRYGITQLIFLPKPEELNKKAKKIRSEDVVKIEGVVNKRPSKTENPNISTGLIEICVERLTFLSQSDELPFELDQDKEVSEELKLQHRYLYLRKPEITKKFILRHKLNQGLRDFLNKKDFLEVETPILTKSTPEGARDFLVPSRLQPAKFYALPQSPQLFKQILMVSGLDKYYQIVRCFRDEDLRKDRQPEFTQLDIEASFLEEDDILELTEKMLADIFLDVLGIKLKVPFPKISYQESMEKYNSDKPDIKEGATSSEYRFLWVTDFPLFEYNQEDKRWQSLHHPFTAPNKEDIDKLKNKDLSRVRSRSYDLVLNGQEIGSGSVRIHSTDIQEKVFEILGISGEEAKEKFGFLLRSFKFGVPPHAGIAFGLDRLYAIITKSDSIRDIIAFPKTQRGISPLTGAPAVVSRDQLDELNIKTKEQES
ncbi:MAG: aspartate--tRNA ligase [Candidatus Omnitrophica bacterium]|nr:aspartate--tRNA ligase [Candidatus Omnitrophota bacterium]MCF7894163.1 aspartate--tRNA ligase [Candidatus Omnitrophota bacterium]